VLCCCLPLLSRVFSTLLLFALPTALVGLLDLATGPDYGLSIVYLVPVVLAGVLRGPRAGAAIGCEAAGLWLWAEALTHTQAPALANAWNGLSRLVIYVAMGVGAGVMRADRERLKELARRERELARTDPVTGLGNRRAFDEQLKADLARARRDERPLAVMLLDLDNFKNINDTKGHAAGDHVLAEIAEALRHTLREGDSLARIGGDEFAAVLWGVDGTGAKRVGERALGVVQEVAARYPGAGLGVSIGIAGDSGAEPKALLGAADQALYRAKARGKGSVEAAP